MTSKRKAWASGVCAWGVAAVMAMIMTMTPARPAWAAPLDSEAVDRIMALDRRNDLSHAARVAAIRSAFNDLQSSDSGRFDDLTAASLDELKHLWRLAGFMAYATNEPVFATHMARLNDEYVRRHQQPPLELRERLLRSWIALRAFEQARAYAADAGVPMEYIPAVEGPAQNAAGRLGVLRVDTERGVLRRESLSLDDSVRVFVVSFIGCAFSRRAADAIEQDPVLSSVMRARSTWIVQPDLLHFNDVLAWNRSHPSTGFAYVDSMAPWAFIDDWATPTFYVVRRGKVISKVTGWPSDEEGVVALRAALAASGLASASGTLP